MRYQQYNGVISNPWIFNGGAQTTLLGELMYGKVKKTRPTTICPWDNQRLSEFQTNIYSPKQRAKFFTYGNVKIKSNTSYAKMCEFLNK